MNQLRILLENLGFEEIVRGESGFLFSLFDVFLSLYLYFESF